MRKQKREEEKKILQELDEAMAESAAKEQENADEAEKKGLFKDKTPTTLHCKRCKTVMEKGTCPVCGFRMYVPMDENKKKTIRWIVGGVCVIGFLLIFILTR